jgi:hypothetical protein
MKTFLARRQSHHFQKSFIGLTSFLSVICRFNKNMRAKVLQFPVVDCALQNPMSAPSTSARPSERRLAANRANAQLSTGPTTSEGKAVSSRNAVKTGLTGRTVLLPSEDAADYEAHIERFREELKPVGARETQLVQNLADTQWRLDRIPNLETGLFALGRLRYADLFEDKGDPQIRAALLDAHILMTEAKHFKNLHLQESRLRRQYRQDLQELKELQAQRQQEKEEAEERTRIPKTTVAHAAPNGFEFTNAKRADQGGEKTTDHQRTDSVLSGAGSV